MEIVKKAGTFYRYNDERIGQGKEKATAYIGQWSALEQEIREQVLAAIKSGHVTPEPAQGSGALAD